MKNVRRIAGPFETQPYYTSDQIERTCAGALRAHGLFPSDPQPVRIDRFVEKCFGVSIEYDDLAHGVLGYTEFAKSGVKRVVVSRSLDAEGTLSADRRVRTTLAHEAGHGLLHAHLFVQSGQCKLFPEGQGNQPRVLCRDEGSSRATTYDGCWWEYQANRAIGAFLLPRTLVHTALDALMLPTGGLGLPTLPVQHRDAAIQRLSTVFDVNPVVARFRLLELLPEESAAQMTL